MFIRLLFGLLLFAPTSCFGALSTTTSYFLNVEALTNLTARSTLNGNSALVTNTVTVGSSTFTNSSQQIKIAIPTLISNANTSPFNIVRASIVSSVPGKPANEPVIWGHNVAGNEIRANANDALSSWTMEPQWWVTSTNARIESYHSMIAHNGTSYRPFGLQGDWETLSDLAATFRVNSTTFNSLLENSVYFRLSKAGIYWYDGSYNGFTNGFFIANTATNQLQFSAHSLSPAQQLYFGSWNDFYFNAPARIVGQLTVQNSTEAGVAGFNTLSVRRSDNNIVFNAGPLSSSNTNISAIWLGPTTSPNTANYLAYHNITTGDTTFNTPLTANFMTWRFGGAPRMRLNTNSLRIPVGIGIAFNNNVAADSGSDDAGVIRDSAGVVRVSNGSTGVGSLIYSRQVMPKTGAYSVVATNSNAVISNEGASALQINTLPAAAVGLTVTFVIQDADGLEVLAVGDDTIRIAGNVTGAAGNIQATTIGNTVTLCAINSTEWVSLSHEGTWTVSP